MPCGQYGRADACVAKATAIANATPATNVFMVSSPISLDASAPLMTNKGLVGGANICEAALKP